MFQQWIANAVILFVVRQIGKFGAGIDWAKVRTDVDARIRKLVPSPFFGDIAVTICDSVVTGCSSVLADTADITKIAELGAAGKWIEAAEFLGKAVEVYLGIDKPAAA